MRDFTTSPLWGPKQQHELEQGTQEWHEFRANHYGASEVNAALGRSPFFPHTPEELKAVRLGILPPPFYSQAMRDGNRLEDEARSAAEEIIRDAFQPAVYSAGKISASLDGINLDGDLLIEIKVSAKPIEDLLDQYRPQVIQQMMVTGIRYALLVAYRKETKEVEIIGVEWSDEWASNIIEAWERFETVEPAPPKEEERDDEEWVKTAEELREVKTAIDALKKEEAALKARLIELADGKAAKGAGVTVYPTKPRTTIDYQSFLKQEGLEVPDDFKKAGKPTWAVRVK